MPTAKSFTPADIFQGPADIYLDVQAPPSAVPPVQYVNTVQLDASGQPADGAVAGVHLGLSEGPASLSITPKFSEIRADQYGAPVDAAIVSLACEIDVALKELTLANIKKYFAGAGVGTYSNIGAGATNPAADFLQVGSPTTANPVLHTLMLIAPDRGHSGKFVYVMAYSAYLASAVALPLDRKKETVIKLKWKCIGDTARVAKDQVLQIVRTT